MNSHIQTGEQGAAFGELRSLLGGPPTAARWRQLLELLEQWHARAPRQLTELALPYARARLKAWPVRARRLPRRWLEALIAEQGQAPGWWLEIACAIALPALLHRAEVRHIIHGLARGAFMQRVRSLALPSNYMRSLMALRLSRSPHLHHLTHLDVSYNHLGMLGVHALAHAEALAGLEELELAGNGLEARGVGVLLGRSDWRGLRQLELSQNRLGDEGCVELARAPAAARLTELGVACNDIGDGGARALAISQGPSLERLELGRNRIGPRGVRVLAESCASLHALDLSDNPLGADGVCALAEGERWGGLRRLDLAGTQARHAGLAALAQSEALGSLEQLELSSNLIDAASARALGQSAALARVARLGLGSTELGPEALGAILEGPLGRGLVRLDLSFNPLGDQGLRALLEAPGLARLERLQLNHCELRGELAVGGAALTGLEELELHCNPLGDAFVERLARQPWMARVRRLTLRRCGIGDAGAQAWPPPLTWARSRNSTSARTPSRGEAPRRWCAAACPRSSASICRSARWGTAPRASSRAPSSSRGCAGSTSPGAMSSAPTASPR